MKLLKLSYVILIALIIGISINSYYIRNTTDRLDVALDAANTAEDFENIYSEFKEAENIISLTVSHDDLTKIEEGFAEIIGAAYSNDTQTVLTIKSRLKESLRHLGRLSGFNIESIL